MANPLAPLLRLFGVKAQPATGRLPLPQQGYGGYGQGLVELFADGTGTFRDYLLVGGKPLPIKPSEAGDLLLNPIVVICLNWMATSWWVAQPQVGTQEGDKFTPVEGHPLPELLRRPNSTYGGKWLTWAWLRDYWRHGNAYGHIVTVGRQVKELNLLPACLVEPQPDGKGYLNHYLYRVNGDEYQIEPERVVHFRYGINPANPLLGLPPLESAFREIVTDNSSSDYSAGLFKNGGMPPGILTPKLNKDNLGMPVLSADEAGKVREALQEKMAANPGQIRVLTAAMELIQLAFEPGKMGLDTVREEPETRIPALFGIPPQVLGLRAGMLHQTYNNLREAKQAAWGACLIPLQDYFAEELGRRLLPLYEGSEGRVVRYDRSGVEELQEDILAKREAARADFQARLITLEEARAEGGRQTDETIRQQLEADHPQPAMEPGLDPTDPDPDPGPQDKEAGRKRRRPFRVKAAGTPEGDLQRAVDSFRAALARREESAVEALTEAYRVAEGAIRERLEALLARLEQAQASGEPVSESWLYQERRYQELLYGIEEELRALSTDGAGPLGDAQRDAIADSLDHTIRLGKAALGPAPEGVTVTFNRLPVEMLESLVGFAGDGTALSDLLLELGPEAAGKAREALINGVVQGLSPRQVARDLQTALDVTRARALTIARTEMLRVAREASRQSYAANQDVVTGWVWVAELDGETCPCCWAMHGTEHGPAEILDDHPNGRCVAVPKTKSWAELTGDTSLPDTRPQVPAGVDEFAQLTAAEQEAILGPGMYALYASGQVGLEHMVTRTSDPRWGTMRRAATQAEALAAAGAGG